MKNVDRWPRIAVVLAAGTLATSACTSAEDESPQAAAPPPPAEAESPPSMASLAEHMHGHLDEVNAIKDAVIGGDLESARAPAVWLSEHEEPDDMPADWSPYHWEMRQYAATIAAARELRPAAVAVSEIVRTCGECHRDNSVSIELTVGARPPPEQRDVQTEMQRHLWAADRLWASLLSASDTEWAAGMAMLEEVQLVPAELDNAPERADQVQALAARIRALGEEGGRTPAGPARSVLYGEFLATCASCHTLTDGGPNQVAMQGGDTATR